MNIFDFSDYRAFLRAHFAQSPKKGRGKFLELAQSLRMHPTAISQIFSGIREFSDEQALEISELLDLVPIESNYFRLLVRFENAGTQKLKNSLKSEIENVRRESKSLVTRVKTEKVLTDTEKAIFYSSWLYSGCRLYCSTSESGRTLDEIFHYFQISRSKAINIMEFLTRTNLIIFENEKYRMGSQSTFVDRHSPFLPKHLSNWRLKALQKVDTLNDEELMFSAPFSVSKKDFPELREKLAQTIKEFTTIVKDSESEEIACLNIDLFWIRGMS